MKVLALGCCLLALLALGQAQNNTTTPMPGISTQATIAELSTNPDMNATTNHMATVNTTSGMMTTTEELKTETPEGSNSTSPVDTTTPNRGGPDVKASLLFSILPLVLYAISL